MASQNNRLVLEIGDASSRPFSWSVKGGSFRSKLKDYLDSVKGMSSSENWKEMDPIIVIAKGDKANYQVTIKTWFSRVFKLSFGGEKPKGPDYKIASRLDFNVEGAEKEIETNFGEQFRLMSTLTDIGVSFLNEAYENDISLEEFNIYAKPDDESETSRIDSRRGKMYFEFVKKNLNKLNFKVTTELVNFGENSAIRIKGGTWTRSGGPIPGAYYNESISFKKFSDFVSEDEDMTTFLKLKTKEKEAPIDKEKEKEMEKYREDKHKTCPRCGQKEGECECPEKDFYSTINAYRIPKGDMVYVKEMKNLKSIELFESVKKDEDEFKHVYNMPKSWWKGWEKKNREEYDFHHVKNELYWDIWTKDGVHLMIYDYEKGKVYTDEPENFLET